MKEKKGSLDFIKKINRELVLETIRLNERISRAKIAKKLNLSRSTVSSIVDELIAKRFVIETGVGSSTAGGGRKGIELSFNPKSGYGVGVDIGGTKILIHITDLDGNVVFREKVKSSNDVSTIARMIRDSLLRAEVREEDVLTIGFGVPGITDPNEGIIIEAPALQWNHYPFKQVMQSEFTVPIFVNNDVNCAALGERWLGAAKKTEDLVFIALGTAVGSAIVANGSLIEGSRFMAGEVAYLIFEEDISHGRRNRFGEFGVFEKKISGTALSQTGYPGETLFKEYEAGNSEVVPIMERFVLTLSVALANITSLLNPEKIIIGGGVSQSMACVLESIRKTVSSLTPIEVSIDLSGLGENSGSLGAVAYALEQVRNIE